VSRKTINLPAQKFINLSRNGVLKGLCKALRLCFFKKTEKYGLRLNRKNLLKSAIHLSILKKL
jgi:hypothetical protein